MTEGTHFRLGTGHHEAGDFFEENVIEEYGRAIRSLQKALHKATNALHKGCGRLHNHRIVHADLEAQFQLHTFRVKKLSVF